MTPRTREARQNALDHIEAAQRSLYAAAQAACDLQGWAGHWNTIGDRADATQALWRQINAAPLPTGHDADGYEINSQPAAETAQ